MATDQFTLADAPADARERELWMQHAAGFMLFEDVRAYAIARIDPTLDAGAHDAAVRAVNDAVYGLMMVLDGVSGTLQDGTRSLHLETGIRLTHNGATIAEVSLASGDGMCMGYHSWLKGDFGSTPVVRPRV